MSNNTVRRGDRGLGKTASGGNKGSFASHEREAAAAPPPVSTPASEEQIAELLEEMDVDFGNGEIYVGEFLTVEGPGNTTVTVPLDGGESRDEIAQKISAAVDEFDPDEEFSEVWSEEFGSHNGLTPSQFLRTLEDDKQYLTSSVSKQRNAPEPELAFERAKRALEIQGVSVNGPNIEAEMQDSITDLLHFAKKRGIDVDDMLRRARNNFEAELEETAHLSPAATTPPTEVETSTDGHRIERWLNDNGKRHNPSGPAVRGFRPDGSVEYEEFWIDGEPVDALPPKTV